MGLSFPEPSAVPRSSRLHMRLTGSRLSSPEMGRAHLLLSCIPWTIPGVVVLMTEQAKTQILPNVVEIQMHCIRRIPNETRDKALGQTLISPSPVSTGSTFFLFKFHVSTVHKFPPHFVLISSVFSLFVCLQTSERALTRRC